MVYWTIDDGATRTPHAQEFASEAMGAAMKFMEELRARQRAGEGVCFVTMSSENPHSVGHPGVADPAKDYAWKKRRR
jgi:hypothetical protein